MGLVTKVTRIDHQPNICTHLVSPSPPQLTPQPRGNHLFQTVNDDPTCDLIMPSLMLARCLSAQFDSDHDGIPTLDAAAKCALNGALVCSMLCFTASPPLTVFSVITYLIPASTSNKTPSKTSSTTDRSPLAPVPRSRAILAISLIAASVNTKSAPWNLTSFLNCLALTPSCGIPE